ncbi:hypothetical protein ACSR9H_04210 [Citrobacter koseri]|uniref:hypothetical protein n=1 Tax=Citrobacter koseri TaxID=545 RepID=UPI0040415B0B
MRTLTTEEALQILINWLRGNIDCGTPVIFDNDKDNADSTMQLPHMEQSLNDVRVLHHLQLLHHAKAG